MSDDLKGKKAPAFSMPDAEGKVHKLGDYAGRKVVLYFYPKDDTPGCTREACGFRDLKADFDELRTVILGVSSDAAASHQKFTTKYGLNFPLLTDKDHAVASKYGAYGEKSMYGKKVTGVIRSTFVIDAAGKVAGQWRGVKVDGHMDKVLEFVKGMP
ncbi:MAG: thioredoxin-dependent thiol peroxidase [Deltaproteobacteria bacterium]|nr:thioredoxin-dependent thiol peroxidase [Deltaproteobacteria bacterium]